MEEVSLVIPVGENKTGESLPINTAYLAAEICLAVAATASNLVVLVAFCTNGKLRTIPNWYIASLSVSDLLMGIFGIPFILLALSGKPENNFGLCVTAATAIVWIELCSCFTLFALSCDRYFAVCKPLEYTTTMSHRRVMFRITLAWVTPLLYSLLVPLVWKEDPHGGACLFVEVTDLHCMMVAYLAFFLPFYAAMCFMYYRIFQAIRKQLKRLTQIQEVGIRLRHSSCGSTTKLIKLSPNATTQSTPVMRHMSAHDDSIRNKLYAPLKQHVTQDLRSCAQQDRELKESRNRHTLAVDLRVEIYKNLKGSKLFVKRDRKLRRCNSFPVLDDDATILQYRLSEDNRIREENLSLLTDPTENNNQPQKPSEVDNHLTGKRDCDTTDGGHLERQGGDCKESRTNQGEQDRATSRENERLQSAGSAEAGILRNSSSVTKKSMNQIQSNRYRQERKTAILFVFILAFFFVSWSPIYIVDIFLAYDVKVNQTLVNFAVLLSHFNSAFNPMLYAYKREFRNTLIGWVRTCRSFVQSKCRGNQNNQVYPYVIPS